MLGRTDFIGISQAAGQRSALCDAFGNEFERTCVHAPGFSCGNERRHEPLLSQWRKSMSIRATGGANPARIQPSAMQGAGSPGASAMGAGGSIANLIESQANRMAESGAQQQAIQQLASRSQMDSQNRTLAFQAATQGMNKNFECLKEAIRNGART